MSGLNLFFLHEVRKFHFSSPTKLLKKNFCFVLPKMAAPCLNVKFFVSNLEKRSGIFWLHDGNTNSIQTNNEAIKVGCSSFWTHKLILMPHSVLLLLIWASLILSRRDCEPVQKNHLNDGILISKFTQVCKIKFYILVWILKSKFHHLAVFLNTITIPKNSIK